MRALLFPRAHVGDVDRGPDGVAGNGPDHVLPANDAIAGDAKDAVTLSQAGFLGGRATNDVPDPNALPRLVGVHGHPQPGARLDGLRRRIGRKQDGEPQGERAAEDRWQQPRPALTRSPTAHPISMGSGTPYDKQDANARTRAHKTPQRALHAGRCAPRIRPAPLAKFSKLQKVRKKKRRSQAKPGEMRSKRSSPRRASRSMSRRAEGTERLEGSSKNPDKKVATRSAAHEA